MKVELNTSNKYAVIEIITTRGRFMVRYYDPSNMIYAREQANELARILGCSVEEVAQ